MYPQNQINRRNFIKAAAIATAGAASALNSTPASAQPKGLRPGQAGDVAVLNPQNRVPVSLIIDDSTCLVNMGHFCMPQMMTPVMTWAGNRIFKMAR